ncbi:alanyl-tRNA editing protein [Terrarubrum flagellatum]|uniref:alanyl-tRNA editing protein n=1 Tax=Terrirubrum flagellatum TaxID=2895980 RepID=UPI003144F0FE
MPRAFYHANPDVLTLHADVVAAQPGRVLLNRSPFYPGGGGQLADRGVIRWVGGECAVQHLEPSDEGLWHILADPVVAISGLVEAAVDPAFRRMMRELHTGTHILNALVFQSFDGALVTGAQMAEDGTARLDFDLPDADNDRLRIIEARINDVIRQDLIVSDKYVRLDDARSTPGLIRSKSVSPPADADGMVRIVEIAGLDQQACGGTHVASTRQSRRIRILKIDNKGRHNRRIRIGLIEAGP